MLMTNEAGHAFSVFGVGARWFMKELVAKNLGYFEHQILNAVLPLQRH